MVAVVGVVGVFGDTATAAVIAGIFSTVNLILNTLILKKAHEARSEAYKAHVTANAPRRFLYDNNGKILGSIPEPDRNGMGALRSFEPLRDGPDAQDRWSDET